MMHKKNEGEKFYPQFFCATPMFFLVFLTVLKNLKRHRMVLCWCFILCFAQFCDDSILLQFA